MITSSLWRSKAVWGAGLVIVLLLALVVWSLTRPGASVVAINDADTVGDLLVKYRGGSVAFAGLLPGEARWAVTHPSGETPLDLVWTSGGKTMSASVDCYIEPGWSSEETIVIRALRGMELSATQFGPESGGTADRLDVRTGPLSRGP